MSPSNRFLTRRISFPLLLLASIACASAAAPVCNAKEETWVEVRSSHFIVVSDAGEKQARHAISQFEQIRSVFRLSLASAANAPSPLITIIALKDENSFRELMPDYWVKGHMHPAGIFVNGLDQFYAGIQLDAGGSNPYQAIYHEYYHSLTVPYFPGLPTWLSEGLAEFFSDTEVTDKQTHMGEPDQNLILELRQTPLIPLNILLQVNQSSPYYNEQNKTSVFYAESWALTHYFMVGDNSSHKKMLADYLVALQGGATEDEAAANAFGDVHKLQEALQAYIGRYSFFQLDMPSPPKVADDDFKSRTLSEAEVDAYRGGFTLMRGKIQEAKPMLDEAVHLDPQLPLARQNQGLERYLAGDSAGALDSFSQAIALDPNNAMTHYFRALLYLRENRGRDPGSQSESDLRQSIALSPDFAPSYDLLAVHLGANPQTLSNALAYEQKAVTLEPGRPVYWLDFAQLCQEKGLSSTSHAAALRALNLSKGTEFEVRVKAFLDALQGVQDSGAEQEKPDGAPQETEPK